MAVADIVIFRAQHSAIPFRSSKHRYACSLSQEWRTDADGTRQQTRVFVPKFVIVWQRHCTKVKFCNAGLNNSIDLRLLAVINVTDIPKYEKSLVRNCFWNIFWQYNQWIHLKKPWDQRNFAWSSNGLRFKFPPYISHHKLKRGCCWMDDVLLWEKKWFSVCAKFCGQLMINIKNQSSSQCWCTVKQYSDETSAPDWHNASHKQ